MTAEPITLPESKRLVALEAIIKAGQQTFVEVGNALSEIKESRLYRCDFETFDDYCREKWGWSRVHAHRMIEAAEVVETLPMGNKASITSERQAREVAKVEPAKRAEVVEKAAATAKAESRPMTAKDIQQAAEPVSNPEPLPKSSTEIINEQLSALNVGLYQDLLAELEAIEKKILVAIGDGLLTAKQVDWLAKTASGMPKHFQKAAAVYAADVPSRKI